jgi:hypothetical protein
VVSPVSLMDEDIHRWTLLQKGHLGPHGPCGLHMIQGVPQVVVVVVLQTHNNTAEAGTEFSSTVKAGKYKAPKKPRGCHITITNGLCYGLHT